MKKAIAILLVAVIALTGIFAQGSEEKATTSSLKTLNVAYMPNYASLCSVMAAIETGAFEEEGLKVNLVEFADGPTIIAAMESGSIDIGYIGHGAHKLCINGRASIFAFAHLGNGDAIVGLKSHGVESLADLRGKKVGYSSGTSSENILMLGLKRAGLTMNDITAYEMDASSLTSAMTSGSLDACATWSPSTETMCSQIGSDAVVIAKNETFSDETVNIASWIVMPKWAEANHDTLVKFTRALYKGEDFRAKEENMRQVAEWVAKQVAGDVEIQYQQVHGAKWYTEADTINGIKDGSIKALYEVQKLAFGDAVNPATPVENYVLFDIMLEAAHK